MMKSPQVLLNCLSRFSPIILGLLCITNVARADLTTARLWNEQLLHAISIDTARPTVHARNLFHLSAAMYDAWARAMRYFSGQVVPEPPRIVLWILAFLFWRALSSVENMKGQHSG
jgi:hypothetical protein